MNKDTVVASIIGFGLGLVAAIALWVVPRVLPKAIPKIQEKETAVEEQQKPEEKTSGFTVSVPSDGEITNEKTVKITGISSSNSLVVVSTFSDNETINPETNGSFSTNIDLTEGSNEIVVTNYTPDKTETKRMFVFYYPENI